MVALTMKPPRWPKKLKKPTLPSNKVDLRGKMKELSDLALKFKMQAVSTLSSNELTKRIELEDWEMAEECCRRKAALAGDWTSRPGFFEGVKTAYVLPIHLACSHRPTPSLIDALAAASPSGLRAEESAYRRLPLHVAARSNASPEVIRRLIQHYPEAAGTADALGRLPIHYRLSNGADQEGITALIEACPVSVRAYDGREWTPLHVACSVGASRSIIETFVGLFPESVVLATSKGSTPRKCCRMAPHTEERDQITEFLRLKEEDYVRDQPRPMAASAAPEDRDEVPVLV